VLQFGNGGPGLSRLPVCFKKHWVKKKKKKEEVMLLDVQNTVLANSNTLLDQMGPVIDGLSASHGLHSWPPQTSSVLCEPCGFEKA
jgi:hypothetical protein